MIDSEQTRFIRLRADVERSGSANEVTQYVRAKGGVVLLDERRLFNRHQLRLAQILREHPAPGVAIFAVHPVAGIAGHFWLSATDVLRAGTIGRHSAVDLFLTDDRELSLRHLLVLVRQTARGLRIRVADLATPSGFHAEQGGALRAVQANGTLFLRVARYSMMMFPTGVPRPWDSEAKDPWLTLPARELIADERTARPSAKRMRTRPEDTHVSFPRGLAEPGPEPLVEPGESIEGELAISSGGETSIAVGATALERGILVGRYARCARADVAVTDAVSRVHAVLIRSDGALHLIDAGSTNGTFLGEREIRCAVIEPGSEYRLGRAGGLTLRWTPRR